MPTPVTPSVDWKQYAPSQDEVDAIHAQKYTDSFSRGAKNAAASILMMAGYQAALEALPRQHHQEFTKVWRLSGLKDHFLYDYRQRIHNKVADLLEELDDETGQHGRHAAAWMASAVARIRGSF